MIVLSIVTPTLGNPSHLQRLFATLATQDSAVPTEIILSTTGIKTEQLLAHLPQLPQNFTVRVIENNTAGIATARNSALRAAQGQYLLFLDDDCSLPNAHYLSHLLQLAKSDPQSGWAGSYIVQDPTLNFTSAFYNYLSNLWLKSFNSKDKLSVVLGGCAFFSKAQLLSSHALFQENSERAAEEFLFSRTLIQNNISILYRKDLSVLHNPECTLASLLQKAQHHGRALGIYKTDTQQCRCSAFVASFKETPQHSIKFFPLLMLFLAAGRWAYFRRSIGGERVSFFGSKKKEQYIALRKPFLKRS